MIVNWTLPPEAYPTGHPIIYTITLVPLDGPGETPTTSYALGDYIVDKLY